jgi:hypothetical protein
MTAVADKSTPPTDAILFAASLLAAFHLLVAAETPFSLASKPRAATVEHQEASSANETKGSGFITTHAAAGPNGRSCAGRNR